MKTKYTLAQVDEWMELKDGSAQASEFFDSIINWISIHRDQLIELFDLFQSDTGSEISFNDFNNQLFLECEAGQLAAQKLIG